MLTAEEARSSRGNISSLSERERCGGARTAGTVNQQV